MIKRKAFTLIELMVVVLIVAILAAAAIPIMRGRIDAAKWAEGKAGAGTVATSIRAYAAEKGVTNGTAGFQADEVDGPAAGRDFLGITTGDLNGTYFTDACYAITGSSYNATGLSFIVTISAGASANADAPSTPASYTLSVTSNGPALWDIP